VGDDYPGRLLIRLTDLTALAIRKIPGTTVGWTRMRTQGAAPLVYAREPTGPSRAKVGKIKRSLRTLMLP